MLAFQPLTVYPQSVPFGALRATIRFETLRPELSLLANRQLWEFGPQVEVPAVSGESPARACAKQSCVSKLANFFPDATPSSIRICVERLGSAEPFSESTVIEFGTQREALFACRRPLEFADRVHLRNSDGSLDVDARVVAVQYHNGQTAVAARFTRELANWIVKS